MSKKLTPLDTLPQQMLVLLVEQLRSKDLPDLAVSGAWCALRNCLAGRSGVVSTAIEIGMVELAARHFQHFADPADAVSILRGKAGLAYGILAAMYELTKSFAGQAARPDLEGMVISGLFDICTKIVAATASAGATGLQDVNRGVLITAIAILTRCRNQPGCEAKIRSIASALAFCMDHSLEFIVEAGATTGAEAAKLICSVFGRDEDNAAFTFMPDQIETITEYWSHSVRGVGWRVK